MKEEAIIELGMRNGIGSSYIGKALLCFTLTSHLVFVAITQQNIFIPRKIFYEIGFFLIGFGTCWLKLMQMKRKVENPRQFERVFPLWFQLIPLILLPTLLIFGDFAIKINAYNLEILGRLVLFYLYLLSISTLIDEQLKKNSVGHLIVTLEQIQMIISHRVLGFRIDYIYYFPIRRKEIFLAVAIIGKVIPKGLVYYKYAKPPIEEGLGKHYSLLIAHKREDIANGAFTMAILPKSPGNRVMQLITLLSSFYSIQWIKPVNTMIDDLYSPHPMALREEEFTYFDETF